MKLINKTGLKGLVFGLIASFISGCSTFLPSYLAFTNEPLTSESQVTSTRASFNIIEGRGKHPRTLLVLALSGGGSRAAYLSASAMLKMQTIFENEGIDLLGEVDAISSVSGGSLPAAYYAVSYDPEDADLSRKQRIWDEKTVKSVMTKKYLYRWYGNLLWPSNILKFWTTSFDRSDIMAQTFADNLFDVPITGRDYTFADMNPERPNIILNATNGTKGHFAESFTFTQEDFTEVINSDIHTYDISRAVMGTAAFPALFNYMTLRNFHDPKGKQYVHLFDGGSHDNLGLSSVRKLIEHNKDKFDRIGVILMDAFTNKNGISDARANPRGAFDYLIDTNFIDSFDVLLARNRNKEVWTLIDELDSLRNEAGKETVFYHMSFGALKAESPLSDSANEISTNFVIGKKQIATIDEVVDALFVPENACLKKIKNLVANTPISDVDLHSSAYCQWSNF